MHIEIECPDKVGLIFIIAGILKSANCNILSLHQCVHEATGLSSVDLVAEDPFKEADNIRMLLTTSLPPEARVKIETDK